MEPQARELKKKRPSGHGLNLLAKHPANQERVYGVTPREKDLTITFGCQFEIKVPDVTLTTMQKAFTVLLPEILVDFIQKALIGYGELVMVRKRNSSHARHLETTSVSSGRPVRESRWRY